MRVFRAEDAIQLSWKHANLCLEKMKNTFCILPSLEIYWDRNKPDYKIYSVAIYFVRYSAELTIKLDKTK